MTHDENPAAVFPGLELVTILVVLGGVLALYVFSSFCFKRICEKCGVRPGVLVWIPIVRLVPLLKVAKMPVGMIILFIVPFANLVVFFIMWAKICVARGKSGWLVLWFLVPIANIVLIPYLALGRAASNSNSPSLQVMSLREFCEQCGKPLEPGARFCETCGAAVTATG